MTDEQGVLGSVLFVVNTGKPGFQEGFYKDLEAEGWVVSQLDVDEVATRCRLHHFDVVFCNAANVLILPSDPSTRIVVMVDDGITALENFPGVFAVISQGDEVAVRQALDLFLAA